VGKGGVGKKRCLHHAPFHFSQLPTRLCKDQFVGLASTTVGALSLQEGEWERTRQRVVPKGKESPFKTPPGAFDERWGKAIRRVLNPRGETGRLLAKEKD